jgi:hypothetical protein
LTEASEICRISSFLGEAPVFAQQPCRLVHGYLAQDGPAIIVSGTVFTQPENILWAQESRLCYCFCHKEPGW